MTEQTKKVLLDKFTKKYNKIVAENYIQKGHYVAGKFIVGNKIYTLSANFNIIGLQIGR